MSSQHLPLFCHPYSQQGIPRWHSGKESTSQYKRCKRGTFNPWVENLPGVRKWQPTLVFLPRKFHGQRTWWATVNGVAESDMTEHTQNQQKFIQCFFYMKMTSNDQEQSGLCTQFLMVQCGSCYVIKDNTERSEVLQIIRCD